MGTAEEVERRQKGREQPSVYQCTAYPSFLGEHALFLIPLLLSEILWGAIT